MSSPKNCLRRIKCCFWTLTIQTTVKYIILVLRADNKGEGGIFSLYNLLKRRYPQLIIGTVIGGAMLLADGIITPPLSVSSAIEGLKLIDGLEHINTVPIVITILIGLFMIQRAGTSFVGKSFGPIMLVWFSMLTVLGVLGITQHPEILKALSPNLRYIPVGLQQIRLFPHLRCRIPMHYRC